MKETHLEFRDPVIKFLQGNNMVVPLDQMTMFVILISLCLLLKRHQLGLLVTYIFVLSWGFFLNGNHFIDTKGATSSAMFIYLSLGISLLALVIIGFITEKKQGKKIKKKLKNSEPKLLFKLPE